MSISFDSNAIPTKDIEDCDNTGCLANKNGKCESTVGECFGYIEPELTNTGEKV